MKKILSIILVAAMLMSLVVMTAGAEEPVVYAPVTTTTLALDENQVDEQGIYYSLDDETMTAIVGKNTYSDTASADAGLKSDSIAIPNVVTFGGNDYNVVAIGRNAFDGTAIREVITAPSVATIGEFAFAGCTELEYVYTNAVEIKGFAFWGCTALTEVYCYMADSIGGGAFWNCSNLRGILALSADVIMEKAFEGCNLGGILFLNDTAPAVAAGALGTTYVAYYIKDATGFENFPISATLLENTILDTENVYAKAGETVEVSVMIPAGAVGGDMEISLDIAEGLSVTGVTGVVLENAAYDASKVTGTVSVEFAFPGTLVILQVKVADDAAAGSYRIAAGATGYTCSVGSVTICDHADTKTVTVKAPSCTEAGTEATVCTACGEVISTVEAPAKDHSYKDFVINPTCTEGGYTRHICECCADAYTDAEVEELGHSWNEGEVIVQASTSKKGLIRYTCLTCGATKQIEIPKIKYGDANIDDAINLTDVTAMLQYIAKWNMEGKSFSDTNADANCDGKVDLNDVTLMLQYIAKWSVTLGPKK